MTRSCAQRTTRRGLSGSSLRGVDSSPDMAAKLALHSKADRPEGVAEKGTAVRVKGLVRLTFRHLSDILADVILQVRGTVFHER